MYEIYETEAFILELKNIKDYDQKIFVFTKDFGFLWLNVSGSRREKSKQKSFIQLLSYSKIFLVKGKNGYRITGGELLENLFFSFENKIKNKIFLNFLFLVRKFLVYEVESKKVFQLLVKLKNELKKTQNLENIEKVEIFFIIKFLDEIGYWDGEDVSLENFLEFDKNKIREKILKINKILRKSFL